MIKRFKDIYDYRELLLNLSMKELKLKYKNSVIGFFWSFLNPLLMLIIYTFAFKVILKMEIENFPIFLLCGLLPWIFFQGSIQGTTNSIMAASNLVKKVYFPREIIPLSQIIANFINYLMTLIVLLIASSFIFKIEATIALLILPIVLICLFLITFGISLSLSALNVTYRDISHFVEVFFSLLFYLTPIVYPIEMLPDEYKTLIYINPMTSIVMAMRAIILNGEIPSLAVLGVQLFWVILSMIIGLKVFSVRQHRFAEEA